MQQRLSLAAALLADPPVLLLDEPTASLDKAGQRDFLDLAAGLRRDGRTLLLASHRAEEIDRLADRVIDLNEGRVVGVPALCPIDAPQAPPQRPQGSRGLRAVS
ncbi:MAG: hypothetical protein ACXWLM_04080, partial [Myxococcales bacterium]